MTDADQLLPGVDLIVNCYERTYRHVLRAGFFPAIEADNEYAFAARIALINNVDDAGDAAKRADDLVRSGEIDEWAWVSELTPRALSLSRLPKRVLGHRPYFLDYGITMAVIGQAPFVLGWDAEVRLAQPANWVRDALTLLLRRADVFSAAPRWPSRGFDTLAEETVDRDGPWRLNWGFSDQLFLLRRSELGSPIYRRFSPGAWARHAEHPWTFETRVEAYQRSARRYRATLETVRFTHNDLPEVVQRQGGRHGMELLQHRLLVRARRVLKRVPSKHPRWSSR